ncbi:DNA circularization protein [Chitinibacteraceae bacterium HSL-7]
MSDWRANLRPASFRGVGFFVDTADVTGGRRVEVHEYPQRDTPYAEDLGRKARTVSVQAWLIGDDYAQQRDRLLGALETGGLGELVHPWLGSLQVSPGEYSYSESQSEGRMCRFSLQFFESGERAFPAASANTARQSLNAADALDAAAVDDFAAVWDVSDPAIEALTLVDVTARLNDVAGVLGFGRALVDGVVAAVHDPVGFALKFLAVLPQTQGVFSAASGAYGAVGALLRLFDRNGVARVPASQLARLPAVQQQVVRNRQALQGLIRQGALASATRLVVADPPAVAQDADRLRSDLTVAHDAEQAGVSPVLAAVVAGQRKAVSRYLQEAVRNGARLVDYRPRDVLPAAVIAYELYDDASRAAEVARRNRVRHPGFVPVQTLRVLDR